MMTLALSVVVGSLVVGLVGVGVVTADLDEEDLAAHAEAAGVSAGRLGLAAEVMRRATIFIWLMRLELKVAPPLGVVMVVVKRTQPRGAGVGGEGGR